MKKIYLLLILLISFVSCEKEENFDNLSNFKESFHSADFKETIPYEYDVDWNSGKQTYSNNLETIITEFPIIYTSSFNPTDLGNKKSPVFTIIAIKNKESYKFYVQKYLNLNHDTFQDLLNLKKEFTGNAKTIDQNANVLFSDLYIEGKLIAGLNKKVLSTTGSTLSQKVMALDRSYYVIVTETWKYWFEGGDGGGGEWTFTHSTFEGRTEEVVWSDNDTELYNYYSSQVNSTGGGSSTSYGEGYAGTVTLEESTIEKIDERNAAFEIIIDPSITAHPCLNKVLEEVLSSTNNLVKKTINQFCDNPKYDLIFKVGNCTRTDEACTDGSNIDTTGKVNIIFENTSTNPISYAANILHEGIHAEIFRFVNESHDGYVDPNDKPQLFEYFKRYAGTIWDKNIDHIYMTQNYITPIASALRELDNNQYPLNYYKTFAWDGLRDWDPNNSLGITDQEYGQFRNEVSSNFNISCDEF